jgi:hypothetical protein
MQAGYAGPSDAALDRRRIEHFFGASTASAAEATA